jgi:hypothetical protein
MFGDIALLGPGAHIFYFEQKVSSRREAVARRWHGGGTAVRKEETTAALGGSPAKSSQTEKLASAGELNQPPLLLAPALLEADAPQSAVTLSKKKQSHHFEWEGGFASYWLKKPRLTRQDKTLVEGR